tara:strand:- start:84 stop:245 length:162 start_codon:yes stop_codon:yes gene_type:complete
MTTKEKITYRENQVKLLVDILKEKNEEIKMLKERIEEIKDTAIYYSKNNIKIH